MVNRVIHLNNTWEPGGSYSAEAQQFIDRTTGLDDPHKEAYATLIDGLVTDGIWDKLLALWVFATDTSANALLNLKSSSFPCVVVGTPNFTQDRGFTGNGSNFSLDTQFIPGDHGGSTWVEDSASYGVYDLSTGVSTGHVMGINWNVANMLSPATSGSFHAVSINNESWTPTASSSDTQGFWVVSRTADAENSFYKNGGSPLDGVDTNSGGIVEPDESCAIFGYRSGTGTTTAGWTSDELSLAFVGGGLTEAEVGNFNTHVQAYMAEYSLP